MIKNLARRFSERARTQYGFQTKLLDAGDRLPFDDNEFDIVFCSSVIEHVTGPKEEILALSDGQTFEDIATKHQEQFAREIRRISKGYFVQTPYRHFPIESHSWLPSLVVYLPRQALQAILCFTNTFWPKKTHPDWQLLTKTQMRSLFPDAEISLENICGLTKSIVMARKHHAVKDTSSIQNNRADCNEAIDPGPISRARS